MDVGKGGGSIALDGVTLRNYPYVLDVAGGTTLVIQAVPSFGRVFRNWSGDAPSPEENPFYLNVDCNKNITANFGIDWKFFGIAAGCLALVIFLGSVLIFRRKSD